MVKSPTTPTSLGAPPPPKPGLDEQFSLLSEHYTQTMQALRIGWMMDGDPDPVPYCREGDKPCIQIGDDEINRLVYRAGERAGKTTRFFLRIVLWAIHRLKHRVLGDIVRNHKKNHPEYVPPAKKDVIMMVTVGPDGAPQLILGRHDGHEKAHYPKSLAHILGDAQGAKTFGKNGGHAHT